MAVISIYLEISSAGIGIFEKAQNEILWKQNTLKYAIFQMLSLTLELWLRWYGYVYQNILFYSLLVCLI